MSQSPSMSPSMSPSLSPSMSQNTFVWNAPMVFPLPDLSGWGQGKQGKSAQRTRKQNVYTPDFTAKTIGIEQKVSKAQMKKLLRKTLTGLEIRPGVWT